MSVGLDLEAGYGDNKGYGATSLTETTSSAISGGVRFGFNVPLIEWLSWYPRLTLSLGSDHAETKTIATVNGIPTAPSSQSSVGPGLNLYAPLLVHPAAHFVVGFGPRLRHDFAVTRGGPNDGSQSTLFGGEFAVGGYWGGALNEREAPVDREKAEKAVEHRFGESGQIVLTMGTDASLSYLSNSHDKGSSTAFNLSPSFDYFFADDISFGADAFVAHSSGSGLDSAGVTTRFSSTTLGVAPRFGGNVTLSAFASIWFQGELGYGIVDENVSSAEGSNEHTVNRAWVELSAPLLIHPSTHFFIGAGPFWFHELSAKDQFNTENEATSLGVHLMIGGYFDASDASPKELPVSASP